VQVDYLVIAVPNGYRYQSGKRAVISSDYSNALSVIETLYGHSRVTLPYRLILIGY
jgi:hypothetical protein